MNCRVVDLDIGDLRIRDIGDTLTPSVFGALTELSLSWNTLTSVRGLLCLPRLKILNLEGNRLGCGTPPIFSRSVSHFTSNGMPMVGSLSPVSGSPSPDGLAAAPGSSWMGNGSYRYGPKHIVAFQDTSELQVVISAIHKTVYGACGGCTHSARLLVPICGAL